VVMGNHFSGSADVSAHVVLNLGALGHSPDRKTVKVVENRKRVCVARKWSL
jgi:hypothetical protein